MLNKKFSEIYSTDLDLKEQVKNSRDYTKFMTQYLNKIISKLSVIFNKYENEELSDSSKYIYSDRYYIQYTDGKYDTSPFDVWRRVARSIASAETYYTSDVELIQLTEEIFFKLFQSKLFLPNSPVLFNVGKGLPKSIFEKQTKDMTYDDYFTVLTKQKTKNTTAACFVLELDDNLISIMETLKNVAIISGAGGGIGLNFGKLRPEYSAISSGGYSSGALSFLETYNNIGENILEGGIRRFAGMAVLGYGNLLDNEFWKNEVSFHPDILDFIYAKNNNTGTSVIRNFNISVGINNSLDFVNKISNNEDIPLEFNHKTLKELVSYDFMDKIYSKLPANRQKEIDVKLSGKINAKKLFTDIVENAWKTGDPGLVFLDKANKYNPLSKDITINSTNPCVVGDTMVAVADGRGFVKIKQLADEGKDIPVYSINRETRKIEIKMMRRPRKTGYNHKIYKVIFDDGNSIRANENHEFILSDMSIKKITELKKGDSISLSPKYLIKKSTLSSYWTLDIRNSYTRETLNTQYKNVYDVEEQENYVNMSKCAEEFKNRREYKITNDELKQIMIEYAKQLRRPITKQIWINYVKQNNLPTNSTYRDAIFMLREVNSEVFKIPSELQNNNYIFHHINTEFKQACELTEYPLVWINDHIEVIKHCEYCGKEFTVPFEQREVSFCSMSCYNKYKDEQNNIPSDNLASVYNHKVVDVIEDGYEDVYNGTVDDNHNFGIGIGVTTDFDVEALSKSMNTGEVNKYNMAFTLQCGERPNLSSSKYSMITPCNLSSIDVSKFVNNDKTFDFESLSYVSQIVLHFLDLTIDLMMFPLDEIKKGVLLLRDAGLGLMGLHGAMILQNLAYDSNEGRAFAYYVMKDIEVSGTYMSFLLAKHKYPYLANDNADDTPRAEIWVKPISEYETNFKNDYVESLYSILMNEKHLNKKLRNISVTSIAPTGTLSQLIQIKKYGDVGSGVEPLFALKYDRYVLNKDGQSKSKITYFTSLFDQVILNTDELNEVKKYVDKNNTIIGIDKQIKQLSFDQNIFKTALEINYLDHLKMLETVQYACSSSVSKTINMTKLATKKDVEDAFMFALKSPVIKGITIYRDGSLETQVLNTKKEEKKEQPVLNFVLDNKGKIHPKERPVIIESLKQKISIKNGKELDFYVELGLDTNNEPFEVFIRSTNTTKEYTQLFNTIGRLSSLAFRSNISVDEVVTQIKKIKDWKNEYDTVTSIIADTINSLLLVAKNKGKKRIQNVEEINSKKQNWKLVSEGYYIDEEGKFRCPICGSELVKQEGCITCNSCGWSACS